MAKPSGRLGRGLTISLSIEVQPASAAKKLLAHPAIGDIRELFMAASKSAPYDRLDHRPFPECTKKEFKSDVFLRADAMEWLFWQLKLNPGDKSKVVKGKVEKSQEISHGMLCQNLPRLEEAYGSLLSGFVADMNPLDLLSDFGYGKFRDARWIISCSRALRQMLRPAGGPAKIESSSVNVMRLADFEMSSFCGMGHSAIQAWLSEQG
jgi:hypothetical protein